MKKYVNYIKEQMTKKNDNNNHDNNDNDNNNHDNDNNCEDQAMDISWINQYEDEDKYYKLFYQENTKK